MDKNQIKSEKDITPEVLRQLRADSGLLQSEFWESVGSSQANGTLFENGKRKRIPRPVRMLVFLKFVCGMPVGATDEEADSALKHGREVAAKIEAERLAKDAENAARMAKEAAQKAKQLAA